MDESLSQGFLRIFGRVADIAASDPQFRAELRSFAEAVITATDDSSTNSMSAATESNASNQMLADDDEHDLKQIAARCRLKAEGCGWAAERFRLLQQGADRQLEVAPGDREIVEKGKSLGCRLWMNCPSAPVPTDLSLYDTLARCFHALAASLDVVCSIEGELSNGRILLNEALELLAEAQSALRAGIKLIEGPTDYDQVEAYHWLRERCADSRLFIERHMREDDPADAASWPNVLDRISDLDLRVQEAIQTQRRQRKLLKKLQYQVGKLASEATETDHHWDAIARTLDDLVREGIAPSDVRLRETLLPHVEQAPDLDEPQGYKLVLREITAYVNSGGSSNSVAAPENTAAEIDMVARLLSGRSVVLIGGVPQPTRKEALEQAFQISELIWIETNSGTSVATFGPIVARPEVAVVLLAIRWSSHSFSGVQRFCGNYDKPLVRLPAGYSPNQVAAQILGQCGERLKAKSSQNETGK